MLEPDVAAGRRLRRQLMLGATVVLALAAAWLVLRGEPTPTSTYGAAYRGLCHAYEEATADRLTVARRSYAEVVRPSVRILADDVQVTDPRAAARLRDAAAAVEQSMRTGREMDRELAAMEVVTREAMSEVGERPVRCIPRATTKDE